MAGGQQKGLSDNDQAQPLEGAAGHEKIGDAGFVFQGQEAVAFGGSRALTADDQPANAQSLAGAKMG